MNNPGTIEWAQGETDFSKAPFTMVVKSVEIEDFSTGSAYEWTDRSGDWQSIKVISGNSTTASTIYKAETPKLSLAQKWNNLSSGTRLGIYCGAGALAAVCISAFLFVFIRQRRRGRAERDAYNQIIEKQRDESYRDQMELRNQKAGGWDAKSVSTQGSEALGGWPGSPGYSGGYSQPSSTKAPSPIVTRGLNADADGGMVVQGMSRARSPTLVSPIPPSPQSAELERSPSFPFRSQQSPPRLGSPSYEKV